MKKVHSIMTAFAAMLFFATFAVVVILYKDLDSPLITKFIIGYVVSILFYFFYLVITSIWNNRMLKKKNNNENEHA